METVAVYAEHPIKTYGVKAEPGFVLLDITCPSLKLQPCLNRLKPGPGLGRAFMVSTWRQDDNWRLSALLHQNSLDDLVACLQKAGLYCSAQPRAASLIHLQGPHFGDRYGILSAALSGLKAAGIAPLFIEACVHSLVIAIVPDDAPAALDGLRRYFSAPE